MSEEITLTIPITALEDFRCSVCKEYLSCSPVRILPDGNCICGKCCPLNSDTPIYRVLAFETVLSKMSFPCAFKKHGCKELVLFGETSDHESQCPYRAFMCPSLTACSWEGTNLEICAHVTEEHPDLIKDNAEFKLHMGEDAQEVFMVIQDRVLFVVKYNYSANEKILKHHVSYCVSKTEVTTSYKIQLRNDSDDECSLLLKPNQCLNYNNSSDNMQNALVLNLNKYLDSLNNPKTIVVLMNLTVTTSNCTDNLVCANTEEEKGSVVNYDLLESLRCEKCQNYLFAPIFNLDGQVVCCDCSTNSSNCMPSTDIDLLKRVTESNYPCPWRDCNYVGKSEEIKIHKSLCAFRQYQCLFKYCETIFKLPSAIDHLKSHNAEYAPDKIILKTTFVDCYSYKHTFTIEKNNTIVAIQHRMVSGPPNTYSITMFSSDEIKNNSNFYFEHQHCKLKSKSFTLKCKKNTDVKLSDLPHCFKHNDQLSVFVTI